MLRALALSFGQLLDARILRVFLKSLLLTLATLAALGVAILFGMQWVEDALIAPDSDLRGMLSAIGLLLALAIAWFLFRAVAIALVGIFADDVVDAVEDRHYAGAAGTRRDVSFARSLRMGLRGIGRVLLTNIAIAPLYLLLLFTGIGTPILFFVVNAWLLGRDLGDMVGARHMPDDELAAWRNRTRVQRFGLGAVGTGLLLVPFVNLVAPVLGAAMATHMFHAKARK